MENKPVLLFDWGSTLMKEFTEYPGIMVDWPRVEAFPGVAETLALLQPDWRMCVASNADVSKEPDIRAALKRVNLEGWFEKVYCFDNVGFKKPDPRYFVYILKDMGGQASRSVMVGDDFVADVLGANAAGLKSVWFNWKTGDEQNSAIHVTIHQFDHLTGALKKLTSIDGSLEDG